MSDTHHTAFPLAWPTGKPRHQGRRTRAPFDCTFTGARDGLLHELKLLGARAVVLSTNITLRRDGLPYAGQAEPDDPGVAVYFGYKGRETVFACDKWDRVRDNLRAIEKTVEALRGIGRWGTGDMVDQAFAGFAGALPAGRPMPGGSRPWWEVFGVPAHTPSDEVRTRHRRMVMDHHPDRGGDPVLMAEVNRAWEEFRKERGGL
jgi:hypothetical protein